MGESFGTEITEYTPSDCKETENDTADIGDGPAGREHRQSVLNDE